MGLRRQCWGYMVYMIYDMSHHAPVVLGASTPIDDDDDDVHVSVCVWCVEIKPGYVL